MSVNQPSSPAPAPDPEVERAAVALKAVRFLWGFKVWIAGLSVFGTAVWAALNWAGNVPTWMLCLVFAAGVIPILAGLYELHAWRSNRKRQRQREEWGVKDSVAAPGYFRLSPWQDTPDDRSRYQRPDGLDVRITDWIRDSKEPLLYLTGISGTGKSSLLNASVLPALRTPSDNGGITHSVVLRGFDDPLQELREWLLRDSQPWADEKLRHKKKLLALLTTVCERLRSDEHGSRLLVVFDQFEELIILHEINSERVQHVRDFLNELVATPIPGLMGLLSLRSDYEGQLETLGLPSQRQHQNWEKVGLLTRGQAEKFLTSADSGLKPGPELLKAVIDEASAIDDTPRQTKPIVINMLGLMLQRLHGIDPAAHEPGTLLPLFVRTSIEAPDVRDVSGRIMSEITTVRL